MAHQIILPLTESEILALDQIIREGAATMHPLSPEERIALSVWNGATYEIRGRTFVSRLMDAPRRVKDQLTAWFDKEGIKQ